MDYPKLRRPPYCHGLVLCAPFLRGNSQKRPLASRKFSGVGRDVSICFHYPHRMCLFCKQFSEAVLTRSHQKVHCQQLDRVCHLLHNSMAGYTQQEPSPKLMRSSVKIVLCERIEQTKDLKIKGYECADQLDNVFLISKVP